jgi:hypothetical protein
MAGVTGAAPPPPPPLPFAAVVQQKERELHDVFEGRIRELEARCAAKVGGALGFVGTITVEWQCKRASHPSSQLPHAPTTRRPRTVHIHSRMDISCGWRGMEHHCGVCVFLRLAHGQDVETTQLKQVIAKLREDFQYNYDVRDTHPPRVSWSSAARTRMSWVGAQASVW